MKTLYTISEVAGYFNVSNQTLHYYDRIGLLKPSIVDPQTKYRYYDQQQFNKMFMIRELKRIGFSLDEIAAFAENKNLESLGEALKINRSDVEERIQELINIRERIDFYLEMIGLAGRAHRKMECEIHSFPVRYAFYINANFRLNDLSQYVEMLYKAYVKAAGLSIPRDLGNKMVLTMDQDKIQQGKFKYYSGIGLLMPKFFKSPNVFVLPESLYASVVHIGDYSGLPGAYKKVCSFIEKNGYSIAGHAAEVSLINIVHTNHPEDFVTEIQIPVKKNMRHIPKAVKNFTKDKENCYNET